MYEAGYPRIRKRFGRLAGYIQLVRPFTLVAPLVAGMIGVLIPIWGRIDFSHITVAAYVGLTLAMTQAVGQCINQYADVDIDKMAKPYRPLPMGILSKEEALGFAWLLAIFAVGRAFTVTTIFGLMTLLLLFFSIFYSLAPLSPRRLHPILNLAWMAVSRGFLPMIAVQSIYGNPQSVLPYSILATTWVFGFQGSKDIPDAEADRKYGIKTVANTYGTSGLKAVMFLSTLGYTVVAVFFTKPIMLLVLPLAVLAIFSLQRKSITENNLSWTCFYVGLALLYLLMLFSKGLSWTL